MSKILITSQKPFDLEDQNKKGLTVSYINPVSWASYSFSLFSDNPFFHFFDGKSTGIMDVEVETDIKTKKAKILRVNDFKFKPIDLLSLEKHLLSL